jgi:hypothetical protein
VAIEARSRRGWSGWPRRARRQGRTSGPRLTPRRSECLPKQITQTLALRTVIVRSSQHRLPKPVPNPQICAAVSQLLSGKITAQIGGSRAWRNRNSSPTVIARFSYRWASRDLRVRRRGILRQHRACVPLRAPMSSWPGRRHHRRRRTAASDRGACPPGGRVVSLGAGAADRDAGCVWHVRSAAAARGGHGHGADRRCGGRAPKAASLSRPGPVTRSATSGSPRRCWVNPGGSVSSW